MSQIFDVAIIGGGVAGLSIAAQISASKRVLLVEGETQLGYHSSGRSAALFSKTYGPVGIRRFSRESEDFWNAQHRLIDGQPLLSARGALFVAGPEQAEDIRAHAKVIGEEFGECLVSANEATALNPLLRAETLGECFYEPEAQDIDVDLLMTLYRKMAQSSDQHIQVAAKVTSLRWQQNSWSLETSAGDFEAGIVVNAAGAWADIVAGLAGAVSKGLIPKRRSVGVLPLPEIGDISAAAMVIDFDERYYFKPEAGRLLISPADTTPVEPHDAYADDDALAEACWHAEQFSSLSVTRMLSTWGGLRTFAPDGNPVIEWDVDAPNFLWSAGQGGYGIQTSPAWGYHVAAMVQDALAG